MQHIDSCQNYRHQCRVQPTEAANEINSSSLAIVAHMLLVVRLFSIVVDCCLNFFSKEQFETRPIHTAWRNTKPPASCSRSTTITKRMNCTILTRKSTWISNRTASRVFLRHLRSTFGTTLPPKTRFGRYEDILLFCEREGFHRDCQ